MKKIILFLFLIFTAFTGYCQWVTDSVVWYKVSIEYKGDSLCKHQFVEGNCKPLFALPVSSNIQHNPAMDKTKDKICKKCLRKEAWRETWYQHQVSIVKPKTEFEILNDSVGKVKADKIKKEKPKVK